MSNVSWYDPKLHYANFIVPARPGFMNHWEPRALIWSILVPFLPWIRHQGPYTVLVWNRGLLNSIPR